MIVSLNKPPACEKICLHAIVIKPKPTGTLCASKSDPVIHQHSSDEGEAEDSSPFNFVNAQPWSCPKAGPF